MLTYEECLAMCELSEQQISAIAEQQHLSPIIAMALGQYLVTHNGHEQIRSLLEADIDHARRCGNLERENLLKAALQHFITTHLKVAANQRQAVAG